MCVQLKNGSLFRKGMLLFTLLSLNLFAFETFKVGMSAPFKGEHAYLGLELYNGSQTYFEEFNRRGGLGGQKIELIAFDDGHRSEKTIQNTVELVEYQEVQYLMNYSGAHGITRVLPLLRKYSQSLKDSIALVFPLDGSFASRHPPYDKWVYHAQSSCEELMKELVVRLQKGGQLSLAVAYENDSDGRSGREAVGRALASRGEELAQEVTLEMNPHARKGYEEQVQLLKEGRPRQILALGGAANVAGLVGELHRSSWLGEVICLGSICQEALVALLLDKGVKGSWIREHLIFIDSLPNIYDESHPDVKTYLELGRRYSLFMPPPEEREEGRSPFLASALGFRGYLNAKNLVNHLKGVPLEDLVEEAPRGFYVSGFDGHKFVSLKGWKGGDS